MSIDCTEGIIEQIDISVMIQSSGYLNSLLLPTTKVDALLSNDRLVTEWKVLQVFLQRTRLKDPVIIFTFHLLAKQYVFLNRAALYPC